MLACDRCQIKINPDNLGFQGDFVEEYNRENIHLCLECGAMFEKMYADFIIRKQLMLVDKSINKKKKK